MSCQNRVSPIENHQISHSMKKKRSRPSNQDGVRSTAREEESEEHRILMRLMEAFTSVSLEEAASAYREANSDVNKAAEILGNLAGIAEDEGTSCSSSSGDGSLSYAVTLMDPDYCYNGVLRRGYRGAKQKKVIAATGTVSNVLGKEYVPSSLRRDSSKPKGCRDFPASKEDADQFLCSMLGENCELSMAVIRDVLCQCGHDVEKALDVLLELSASFDRFENDKSGERTCNSKEGTQFLLGCSGNLTSRPCDSTSCAAETKIQHNMWSNGYHYRNYSEVLTTSDVHSLTVPRGSELELAQNVLQSLFKIPKSAEHDPHNMNWRDLAKKMETLGQGTECDDAADPEHIHAKGDEYQVLRNAARQHWDSMKSFYQKAATAFSNGERDYAAYLSEQGRVYNKIAQEVDEKASQKIFIARNKKIENVITIDLHGQHVKQAIRLLKVHLLFGAYVRSVQIFRVITGCGSHGVGKSKLKQSVMNLLEREGIKWSEENRGTILVRLDEQRKFTFLESESDDDSE